MEKSFNVIKGLEILNQGFLLETPLAPEMSDEALLLEALQEARETIGALEVEETFKSFPPSKSAKRVTVLMERLVRIETSGSGVPVGTINNLQKDLKDAISRLNFGREMNGLPPKTREELISWYEDVRTRLLSDEDREWDYLTSLINSSLPPEEDQQWDAVHSSDKAWQDHCQAVADRAATSTFPDKGLVEWFDTMVLKAMRKLDPNATGITKNEKALSRLKSFIDFYEKPVCMAGGYDAWWALRNFWFRSTQEIEKATLPNAYTSWANQPNWR